LGAIKGPPHLSSSVGHSIHLKYTLTHSLELKISLPQASIQSNLPRRDLSHPLSNPLNLQLSTSSTSFVYSLFLGIRPLDELGVVQESSRLWWTSENLYCPLLRGDLIVKTELNLGNHSARIRVERDMSLCELLNGDVGNICGWPNFGNKSCVFCACSFRFTYCFCLEFDLTLDVIPSD
jgi:hypothetical protein